jgi:hypothetical protein
MKKLLQAFNEKFEKYYDIISCFIFGGNDCNPKG